MDVDDDEFVRRIVQDHHRDEEFWRIVAPLQTITTRVRFSLYDLLRDVGEVLIIGALGFTLVLVMILLATAVQQATS
jgi:hypothetical protein